MQAQTVMHAFRVRGMAPAMPARFWGSPEGDERFDELFASFERAEYALARHHAQDSKRIDGNLRRTIAAQLEQDLWSCYAALCEHLNGLRSRLPEL